MQCSRFNHFILLEDGTQLLFNSASAALAEIEPQHAAAIESLLKGITDIDHPDREEFLEALKQSGFLITAQPDEVTALDLAYKQALNSSELLQLTIAPTLACNFKCDYCFENTRARSMSPKTEEALVGFVAGRLDDARELSITWFGGEPTLRPDIIERLAERLFQQAARHNVKVHPSGIVTNGYLLNREMASRLHRAGVKVAQVTIDGPPEIHDLRRPHRGGGGTFHRIIENIKQSVDVMQIAVRINVDRENIAGVHELVALMDGEGILARVSIQFAPVTSSAGSCADMCDRCYGSEAFAATMVAIYSEIVPQFDIKVEYPQPLFGVHCAAVRDNAFVIAPDGRLFKCWEEIGTAAAVGTVFDKNEKFDNPLRAVSPFVDYECRECSVLPLCLGGCPLHANRNDSKPDICASWRFNLEAMLRLRYHSEHPRARKEVIK